MNFKSLFVTKGLFLFLGGTKMYIKTRRDRRPQLSNVVSVTKCTFVCS